jgi:hypothetical protein
MLRKFVISTSEEKSVLMDLSISLRFSRDDDYLLKTSAYFNKLHLHFKMRQEIDNTDQYN